MSLSIRPFGLFADIVSWRTVMIVWIGVATVATARVDGQERLDVNETVQDETVQKETSPEKSDDSVLPAAQPRVERSIGYWVEQLQHDEYLRREAASKKLMELGERAVPALADAIVNGDLETTTRSVRVLSDLALDQPPDDEAGAWGALFQLAEKSTGSRQAVARSSLREIEDAREVQGLKELSQAGVSIGFGEFAIGALATQRFSLRIDERWNGEIKPLSWLRWVRGIRYVSIYGAAVNDQVVAQMARMPDIHTIVLVDGTLGEKGIAALGKVNRINSLDLRYVKLTPAMADQIAKLPIRESLSLIGTGISDERGERLQEELPGLSVLNRRGGFLGVTCLTLGVDRCEITTVKPNSAASAAGLRRSDVVKEIDGETIEVFADLQRVIGSHSAGDKLNFVIDRYGKRIETEVELGRQLE